MPSKAGRPKSGPKRIMVTVAAHHAEQLQRIADENDTKLATLCANLLERYVFEEQGILASDILKQAVEQTIHKEMTGHSNRVRALLARTALESIATRQVARMSLQAFTRDNYADDYNEQSWQYAVSALRNPKKEVSEAIKYVSENIANDDPAVLLSLRESNEAISEKLGEIDTLKEYILKLVEHQNGLTDSLRNMRDTVKELKAHNQQLEGNITLLIEEIRAKR